VGLPLKKKHTVKGGCGAGTGEIFRDTGGVCGNHFRVNVFKARTSRKKRDRRFKKTKKRKKTMETGNTVRERASGGEKRPRSLGNVRCT